MSLNPFKFLPGRRRSGRSARPGWTISGANVLSVTTGRSASAFASSAAIASAVVREPAAAAGVDGADADGAGTEAVGAEATGAEAAGAEAVAGVVTAGAGLAISVVTVPSVVLEMAGMGARASS